MAINHNMNILSLLSFFIATVYLYLAALVLIRERSHSRCRSLFILMLCLSVWSFAHTFLYASQSVNERWFWYRFSSIGWCLAPAALLHFSLDLAGPAFRSAFRRAPVIAYACGAAFLARSLTGSLVAVDFSVMTFGYNIVMFPASPWLWPFLGYSLLAIASSIAVIARYGLRSGEWNAGRQAVILVTTLLAAIIPAAALNVLLPFLGVYLFPPLAPLLMLIPSAGAMYSVRAFGQTGVQPVAVAEAVMKGFTDSIITVDASGRVVMVNDVARAMLGFSKEEFAAMTIGDLIADAADFPSWLASVSPSGGETPCLCVFVAARNTDPVPVEITILRINGRGSSLRGAVIIARDIRKDRDIIREIKAAERNENRERFETLLTSLHDIVILFDTGGVIRYITPSVESILDYRPSEMTGRNSMEFVHPDDTHRLERVFAVIMRTPGASASRKVRIRNRDGFWHIFEVMLKNMTSTPSVRGIIANLHDISDRKVVEEELRDLRRNLEIMVRKRTEELADANAKLIREIDERREVESRLREHGRYLAALHDTSLSIMNRLDLSELLRSIISNASMLVQAPHGYISLMEQDGSALVTKIGIGCFSQRIGDRLLKNDGATGQSWESNKTLAIPDYRIFPGRLDMPGLDEIGPLLTIPLRGMGEVRGVLGLGINAGESPFTEGEITLITQLAEMASIALDNSLLFTNIQQEIADRKQAELSLWEINEKYRTILENMQEGYFEMDLTGVFTFVNPGMSRLTGLPVSEIIGSTFRSCLSPEIIDDALRSIQEVRATGLPLKSTDLAFVKKDGSTIAVASSLSLIRDYEGEPAGFRGVIRDITERKELENSLKYLAHHDILTTLPNRILFSDRLRQSLAMANRNFYMVAVLFLDIDNFKEINDSLGHDTGDVLLKEIASRLLRKIRTIDTVARFGGDEFIFILPEIKNITDAKKIVGRVFSAFDAPFELNGHPMPVTTSIGVAFYPVDGSEPEMLLKKADIALYYSKESGKNRFQFYHASMSPEKKV
jgi:diguanylate cyclase (GGDEF)-like protein/PAS domain S-box-containing protein